MKQITPCEPTDDVFGYGCLPCWLEQGKDVNAVVVLEDTYGVLNNPRQTYLCGHHAECVNLSDGKEVAQ